jgi:hypothetical protein
MIRPKQINLRELISVKDLLNSRGFNVKSEGQNNDLLIPEFRWPSVESNILFEALDDKLNRSEIDKLLKKEIDFPTKDSLKKLIESDGFDLDRKKYTTSFEWYIGELLVRNFSAFSHSYSVEIDNVKRNSTNTDSGDFDILSVLRNTNLIYVECKSGKSSNIEQKHILKCIERALAVHCELAIMVIDDTINEEELKWSLKDITHPLASVSFLSKIEIKERPESSIYEWGNCFFISSKKNIEEQISSVLRINEARKIFNGYTSGMCDESYSNLGYINTEIQRC